MRFQPIAARLAFAGFLLALLIAAAAVVATRLGDWSYAQGCRVMIPSVAAAGFGAALGIIWIVMALRRNKSAGFKFGMIGLIGSILILLPPVIHFWRMQTLPPLYDITTDTEHPPAFKALLARRKSASNSTAYSSSKLVRFDGQTSTVFYLQHKYYPDIAKPMVGIRPDKARGTPTAQYFWHAFETVKKMGWPIVAYDAKEGRIEATDTSVWFARHFDIVIRIKPAGEMGARLDIRSESRNGRADAGANAARIKAFMKTFGPP